MIPFWIDWKKDSSTKACVVFGIIIILIELNAGGWTLKTVDLTDSKENAKMLIERFLETGEQPDFLEFLCFKHIFIEARFCGYSTDYVIEKLPFYAGIATTKEVIFRGMNKRVEKINTVEHCYCPCEGKDLIKLANTAGVSFSLENGKLRLFNLSQTEISQNSKLEHLVI